MRLKASPALKGLTNMSNFHPIKGVGLGSGTQLQVGENVNILDKFTGEGLRRVVTLPCLAPFNFPCHVCEFR